MDEPDPSFVAEGLPPIFEQKAREHAEARRVMDQVRHEEEQRIAAGGTATPWAKRRRT